MATTEELYQRCPPHVSSEGMDHAAEEPSGGLREGGAH